MTAREALALYETRIWERAVRAIPRNRYKRRLFKWAWHRRIFPPYPGYTKERVQLFMTIVEARARRRAEDEAERTHGR
jgi:hypothetical protein